MAIDALPPGTSLKNGQYKVVRVLGEGAQGVTYEAVDVAHGRAVAIKVFSVRGATWKDFELAEREAVVMRGLDHPLIPKVFDHFDEEGSLFLVTEKVEGETLSKRRKTGHRFRTEDFLALMRDMTDVLGYLHGRGVIHRDIKPQNIIRRPDGRYALIDFGSVRSSDRTSSSTIVGTFGFMAPEQFQGRSLPQSDIYGLGATALALISGKEPEDLPHQGLRIDARAALTGLARPSTIMTLEAMVEPDPELRAKSLQELRDWLWYRKAVRAGQRYPNARPPASFQAFRQAPYGAFGYVPPAPKIAPQAPAEPRFPSYFLTWLNWLIHGVAVVLIPLVLMLFSVFLGKDFARRAERIRAKGVRAKRWVSAFANQERSRDSASTGVRIEEPKIRIDEFDTDWPAEEEFLDDQEPNVSKKRRL